MRFSDEPIARLPEALQTKKLRLLGKRDAIALQLKAVNEEIAEFRKNCQHERPPNLTGREFAVYCTICGTMIDSWL